MFILNGGILPLMIRITKKPPTLLDIFVTFIKFCGLYLMSFGLLYFIPTLAMSKPHPI